MVQEWRLVVKHYAGCKINRSAIELDTFLSATTDSGHSWQKTLQLLLTQAARSTSSLIEKIQNCILQLDLGI